jgi:hypothetical protein
VFISTSSPFSAAGDDDSVVFAYDNVAAGSTQHPAVHQRRPGHRRP